MNRNIIQYFIIPYSANKNLYYIFFLRDFFENCNKNFGRNFIKNDFIYARKYKSINYGNKPMWNLEFNELNWNIKNCILEGDLDRLKWNIKNCLLDGETIEYITDTIINVVSQISYLYSCDKNHMIAHDGHFQVLKLILKYKCKDRYPYRKEVSILRYASKINLFSIIKFILKKTLDIPIWSVRDTVDYFAQNGQLDMIKWIHKLFNSRNIKKKISRQKTVNLAATNGHLDIVIYLIKDYRQHIQYNLVIKDAKMNGHTEIVEWITNYYTTPHQYNLRERKS